MRPQWGPCPALMMVTAAALIFFSAIALTAEAQDAYGFERMWPTLQQPWYFNWPAAIAAADSGVVYILDAGNNSVSKFSAEGYFITRWGRHGQGPGRFLIPFALAVGPDGAVHVADTGNDTIQKFSSDGASIGAWGEAGSGPGELNAPAGIAVDAVGDVYVVDSGNNRIQKFDGDGIPLAVWGEMGVGDGQFDAPSAIAVGNGFVYVADTFNDRVQQFQLDGTWVTTWGCSGSQSGCFNRPQGIVVDVFGSVFVVDTGNDRIQQFRHDGTYVTQWGSYGNEEGQFRTPQSITAYRNALYVVDFGNHRVEKFGRNGAFLSSWQAQGVEPGRFDNPDGIAVSDTGRVYVVDTWNHRIQVFDEEGAFLDSWGEPGSEAGLFNKPVGVALDEQRNVYATDSANHRVQKFSENGEFLLEWGGQGTGLGQFDHPEGIAVDNEGSAYVVDTWNHRVQKFNDEGSPLTEWGAEGAGPGQFRFPSGIAVFSTGAVYVVDTGNSRVQQFTTDGAFTAQFGSEGTENSQFQVPVGIAIDGADSLYVVDSFNNRLQQFTLGGNFVASWGEAGTTPGLFAFPSRVAVGPDGALYVTDTANHRVQRFRRSAVSVNNKAIVVAAGGAFEGNRLWDATRTCTNFAYRALLHQGFTKDTVEYRSSDLTLDLDQNGLPDDVDGDATLEGLKYALTEWAVGAEDLTVYFNDHGGDRKFRLSATEVLDADVLADWLDEAQAGVSGVVTVIYDACQSSSFARVLRDWNRVVITSAAADENAYFLNAGTVSFSSFLWTHLFNGLSVGDSYTLARDALSEAIDLQTPQLTDPARRAPNTFIGNATVITGDAPTIDFVLAPQNLDGTSSGTIIAEGVTDDDGIARVWAVITPPGFAPAALDNPIQDLPFVDLEAQLTNWAVVYDGFVTPGTYRIAVYARDRLGNTSLPYVTTASVGNPVRHQAVIVAAGDEGDPLWPAVEYGATAAYNALTFQGYVEEDIHLLSNTPFSPGIDAPASLGAIEQALTSWPAQNAQSLVVYLVGEGEPGRLLLGGGAALTADALNTWLGAAQATISGPIVLVYDGAFAGSFIGPLAPPEGTERIVVASCDEHEAASFLSGGSISFSGFFWQDVLNGTNLADALGSASVAMRFSTGAQNGQLDDNGNGIPNEKSDGFFAQDFHIGTGVLLAGDAPIIGSACPERMLGANTGALLWVDDVTTTNAIDRVWAVVSRPGASARKADEPGFDEVALLPGSDGRYEGRYLSADVPGVYEVAFFAIDAEGNVSLPVSTAIVKTSGPDAFEDDDTSDQATVFGLDGPDQTHNFHDAGDEDWSVFHLADEDIVTIETLNLGEASDTVVQLYGPDATTLIEENDDRRPADYSSIIIRRLTEPGLYFVRVFHADEAVSGEATAYDLRIYREIAPQTPGSIIGQVVSRETGGPIAGAQVSVGSMGGFPYWTCGSDGIFHISPIDSGFYTLHATASGYESGSTTASVTASGQSQPTIRLSAAGPALSLSPSSLTLTFDGEPRSVTVRNSGSGSIKWTATVTSGSGWMSLSSSSGGDGDPFAVTVSENDTEATRTGTIVVRSTGATNSPVSLEVAQQKPGNGAFQCPSLGSTLTPTLGGDLKGALSLAMLFLTCWVGRGALRRTANAKPWPSRSGQ